MLSPLSLLTFLLFVAARECRSEEVESRHITSPEFWYIKHTYNKYIMCKCVVCAYRNVCGYFRVFCVTIYYIIRFVYYVCQFV
jgi:hypothetical protein